MLPTFILEIYNNTFFNEQETYYSLALTKSRWWELYEVEGLDPSFSSLEMSKTSDKTGALNSNTTYDNRSISFSLKLDPLNIDNALKLFSRYLINGTYCVIRIKENTKLFMPCYVSNYTFNRWQNNVTVEINLEAIDRFWHFEERITPYNQSEIFNIVSDVPTRPDILLIDVDLTAYADYFINKVYMTIDSVSLQPHLYQKGVEKIEDYEILEIDTYSNKINTADKFTFHVDCQQQQIYIKSENVTQQIETDISKIWDFQLKSGQHKITVTFDLVKDGQTVHQSVTPSQRLIISTNPLFITYPNSLTDEVDGLVLSENLKPENIKIGTNILGIEGNYGGGGFELYKGITEITPTLTEQSLQTKDTIVRKNITVKAIEPLYEDGVNVVDAVTDEATTATITNSKTITNKSSKVYVRPTIKSEGWYKAQDGDTQTEIQIDEAEQAKIVAENIKKGVSILGVVGTLDKFPDYEGDRVVYPSLAIQTLATKDKSLYSDITVREISPVFEDGTNVVDAVTDEATTAQETLNKYIRDKASVVYVRPSIKSEGWYKVQDGDTQRKIQIAPQEQEKIIPTNIKKGVSILGVEGTLEGGTALTQGKIYDSSALMNNNKGWIGALLSTVDISALQFSSVYPNFSNLFYNCVFIENAILCPNFEISGATSMFMNCSMLQNIKNIETLDVSRVTDFSNMFYGCSSLTTLDLSNFNTANGVSSPFYGMFSNCTNLENITWGEDWGAGLTRYYSPELDLSSCSKLTHVSALDLINKLADKSAEAETSGTTHNIRFALALQSSITDEEKAIATAKGWDIQFA